MDIQKTKEKLKLIAEEIRQNGGTLYYVGGCVRDMCLSKPGNDIDVEIHGLQEDELLRILSQFGCVKKVGKSFPVYMLDDLEVDFSLPRLEEVTGPKHTDFKVTVDHTLSRKEASMRRDFTVNALMYDPLTLVVYDCWEGLSDIEKRIIRHVSSNKFVEDPLRVLRAARFAATLNFDIANETIELCRSIDISSLSKERVFAETRKALMSDKPSIFFESLRKMEQLDSFFPHLKSLIGVKQNDNYHAEDVWKHTMMVIDEAAKVKQYTDNPEYFMFAALLHDIGKSAESNIREQLKSMEKESYIYDDKYRHENIGFDLAEVALRKITEETSLIRYVKDMVKNHMNVMISFNGKSRKKKIIKYLDIAKFPKDLLALGYCDLKGRAVLDQRIFELNIKQYKPWAKEAYEDYLAFEKAEHIQGADLILLGLEPSIDFKKWLERARILEYSNGKEKALKQLSYEINKAKGGKNGN